MTGPVIAGATPGGARTGAGEGARGDGSPRPAAARGPGDWREEALARVRALIREADPEAVEERKWGGVPVWSHAGHICTGETYKAAVKLTFAKGASLPDPLGLFNASLEGRVRRAIDLREGEAVDADAFKALVRAAADLNASAASARAARPRARPKGARGVARGADLGATPGANPGANPEGAR